MAATPRGASPSLSSSCGCMASLAPLLLISLLAAGVLANASATTGSNDARSTYYNSSLRRCLNSPPKVPGVQWPYTCRRHSLDAAGASCHGTCAPGFSGNGASARCTRKGWSLSRVDYMPASRQQPVVLLAFTTTVPCSNDDQMMPQLEAFYADQLRADPNVVASSISVDAKCDPLQGPNPQLLAAEWVVAVTQSYSTTNAAALIIPEAVQQQLSQANLDPESCSSSSSVLNCPQGTISISSAVGTSESPPAVVVVGLVAGETSPIAGVPFTVVAQYVAASTGRGGSRYGTPPESSVSVGIQTSGPAAGSCTPSLQVTDSGGEASFSCVASEHGLQNLAAVQLSNGAPNDKPAGTARAVTIGNLGGQASSVCVSGDDTSKDLARRTIWCCFDPKSDYCGGPPLAPLGPAELERYHMGCSSFTAKPSNRDDLFKWGWCSARSVPVFARSPRGSAVWKAAGTNVHDWWVFHGCDGAELMSDCFGGFMYLEHYMESNQPVAFDPETGKYTKTQALSPNSRSPPDSNFNDVVNVPCDAKDLSAGGVKRCWKHHMRSLHTHPGTGSKDNLDSGMWAEAEWKEQGKPWWNQMILPGQDKDHPASTALQPATWYRDNFLGSSKAATGFVITYPWVCNKELTKGMSAGHPKPGQPGMSKYDFITKMWGSNNNWGTNNNPPFSPNQGWIDYYYDNEAWSTKHWDANSPPPLWQAYMFWADAKDAKHIWGYILAEKGPNGSADVVVRSKAQFDADVKPNSASRYGPFRLEFIKAATS